MHERIITGEKTYHCDICDKRFSTKDGLKSYQDVHILQHLHQRRFLRIYLSTNHSPHDPQNVLLAQTNRPMKTPGGIFSIIPSCQSD